MEEYPSSNQENPDAAKWQNLGNETESIETNPEQFRETTKMIEKLQEMGADKRILENPAFQRSLSGLMSEYGLKKSQKNSIESIETDDGLRLTYTGNHGASDEHDCGKMNAIVDRKGNIIIESAYADVRDDISFNKDAFPGYKGTSLIDNTIEVRELKNVAETTEFCIDQDGSSLSIDKQDIYESQHIPKQKSLDGKEYGIYFEEKGRIKQIYDSNGFEKYREEYSYKPEEYDGMDLLSARIGLKSQYDGLKPTNASFGKRMRSDFLDERVEQTTYVRKEDGIEINDYYKGKNIKIEKVFDEKGQDINSNTVAQAIVKAREEANNE
ncbi:hypothetical protein IKD49_01840 [Candidatus Saccharibacteria bacterium]|nr:hypothetical protein [Candidatus Saccharibacteria bacterium]